MPRVIRFEITAENPERVIKFYESVFGWDFQKGVESKEYWLIRTGTPSETGINGGLMKKQDPDVGVYNSIAVPSIDEYIQKFKESGGTIVGQKTCIPKAGYVAYFKDPEGNIFRILEPDASAK